METFNKRQKEMRRLERQRDKAAINRSERGNSWGSGKASVSAHLEPIQAGVLCLLNAEIPQRAESSATMASAFKNVLSFPETN
jgi:hypothetical protein